MFSKSINLKSFKINKNKKKIQNKLKILLSEKNQLIKSLSENYKDNYDFKKIKGKKNFRLIGMGGSILGSEAIYSFLKEKIKKKVYFFNDMNSNFIKDLKNTADFDKTLFIIISKSGSTTETPSLLSSNQI